MLLTGVDEAGYGPLLGPLSVAGAAFSVPDGRSLRDILAPAVAAPGERSRGRLVVGDSKEVFGATHDPARLERPVLAFLALLSGTLAAPPDVPSLLRTLGIDAGPLSARPWYAGLGPTSRLPRWTEPGEIGPAAASLRNALAAAGASFRGFRARLIPENVLNERFAALGNKATVLFGASADVLDDLTALRTDAEDVNSVMDRQGGRKSYLAALHTRWPQRFAWTLHESPASSSYRLRLPDASMEIRFDVGADGSSPQVGLASMCAKYLRELSMDAWNAHFEPHCGGVARTAGYTTDGRRWLDETRGARLVLGVHDEHLVRTR